MHLMYATVLVTLLYQAGAPLAVWIWYDKLEAYLAGSRVMPPGWFVFGFPFFASLATTVLLLMSASKWMALAIV